MSEVRTKSTPFGSPAEEGKPEYFDRYWITRDFLRTDRRTMERTHLIWSLLERRAGRALDVGCGRGLFAAFLKEQGLDVDAVDISPQAVDLCSQRGVHAYQLDLEEQSAFGPYDLIFCLEVLQQVRDPRAVLLRLVRALAPDGELVVSVPNEFHLLRRLRILAGNIDFGGVDDSHLKLFSPPRGEDLLHTCGLKIRCRAAPSIVPPQFGWLAALGRLGARWWPGGLAISTLYFAGKDNP